MRIQLINLNKSLNFCDSNFENKQFNRFETHQPFSLANPATSKPKLFSYKFMKRKQYIFLLTTILLGKYTKNVTLSLALGNLPNVQRTIEAFYSMPVLFTRHIIGKILRWRQNIRKQNGRE